MESTVSNAFLLLGIGMITVFVVLLLVVVTGNLLIQIINKYALEPIEDQHLKTPLMSTKEIAVVTAVVEHVTSGAGRIDYIEKVK